MAEVEVRKEIQRFYAYDDGGNRYEVVKRQAKIKAPPGYNVLNHGSIDWVLSDGSGVTPLNDEQTEFKVVLSDTIIRKR